MDDMKDMDCMTCHVRHDIDCMTGMSISCYRINDIKKSKSNFNSNTFSQIMFAGQTLSVYLIILSHDCHVIT